MSDDPNDKRFETITTRLEEIDANLDEAHKVRDRVKVLEDENKKLRSIVSDIVKALNRIPEAFQFAAGQTGNNNFHDFKEKTLFNLTRKIHDE